MVWSDVCFVCLPSSVMLHHFLYHHFHAMIWMEAVINKATVSDREDWRRETLPNSKFTFQLFVFFSSSSLSRVCLECTVRIESPDSCYITVHWMKKSFVFGKENNFFLLNPLTYVRIVVELLCKEKNYTKVNTCLSDWWVKELSIVPNEYNRVRILVSLSFLSRPPRQNFLLRCNLFVSFYAMPCWARNRIPNHKTECFWSDLCSWFLTE